ncbi:MAG: hypothetical protein LBF22_02000 [Deltaproteobacteria bacterium]|jgi:hypothetical protein|nr:hypothetical protein [Deltaproteobacteria bacterium]
MYLSVLLIALIIAIVLVTLALVSVKYSVISNFFLPSKKIQENIEEALSQGKSLLIFIGKTLTLDGIEAKEFPDVYYVQEEIRLILDPGVYFSVSSYVLTDPKSGITGISPPLELSITLNPGLSYALSLFELTQNTLALATEKIELDNPLNPKQKMLLGLLDLSKTQNNLS